jgi:hypothetical protein
VLEGVVGCMMGSEVGIKVPQNPDANGVGHTVILINGETLQDGIGSDGLVRRCQGPHVGSAKLVIGRTAPPNVPERLHGREKARTRVPRPFGRSDEMTRRNNTGVRKIQRVRLTTNPGFLQPPKVRGSDVGTDQENGGADPDHPH